MATRSRFAAAGLLSAAVARSRCHPSRAWPSPASTTPSRSRSACLLTTWRPGSGSGAHRPSPPAGWSPGPDFDPPREARTFTATPADGTPLAFTNADEGFQQVFVMDASGARLEKVGDGNRPFFLPARPAIEL
jgi:hypothetical protein